MEDERLLAQLFYIPIVTQFRKFFLLLLETDNAHDEDYRGWWAECWFAMG